MTYRGHVKNGVVIFDEPANLPEGTEVRVEQVTQEAAEPPNWAEVFKDVAGKAKDLPSDLAANHDHYLHGAPKR